MQDLKIEEIYYRDHVNVGNGTISFSHGIFEVPAPATKYILNACKINWQKSDLYRKEMTTPTGASILAGSKAKRMKQFDYSQVIRKSQVKGTLTELPAISFYLIK